MVGGIFEQWEAGMFELILLAIAVALVSAVTHDLVLAGHREKTDPKDPPPGKLVHD
jgi:hypothetical protein